LRERQVARDGCVRVELWAQAFTPRQIAFRKFDGRDFALANLLA